MTELLKYYDEKRSEMLNFYSIIWFAVTVISFLFLERIVTGFIAWIDTVVVADLSWLLTDKYQSIINLIILLVDFFLPASLIWTIYCKRLDYIDKEGWKRHFPQNDISGEWLDHTTYTDMIKSTGWVDVDKIADKLKDKNWTDENTPAVPSSVIISQTCHIIRIEVSHGAGFTWRSLSATWADDSLKILYEVTYNNVLRNKGYPQQRFGFEKMSIDRNGLAANQKPQQMVGQFWHCIANDGKPVLMGDVTYKRK